MPPRTAGFGNRDRFELNGKIGLHWAAGLIVLRECRQWQHNVAFSGSIPLQPAPFLGKSNLWRIVVAENLFSGKFIATFLLPNPKSSKMIVPLFAQEVAHMPVGLSQDLDILG
jgi:hypothetical protein